MKRPLLRSATLVILAVPMLVVSAPGSAAKTDWKREGVRVFSETDVNPDIVKLSDGRFRAYLMSPSAGVTSAISSDGLHFKAESGVRMPGGQHQAIVTLANGSWRMYYGSMGSADTPQGATLSAVSSDGLTFTPEAGTRLQPGAPGSADAGGAIHRHVIQRADGSFQMFYDADGGGTSSGAPNWNGIMSARSKDGLTWTKDAGLRMSTAKLAESGLVWSPFAERTKGKYYLYFSSETDESPKRNAGIYVATSRDGLSFKPSKRPIFGLNPSVGSSPETGPGGLEGNPQDAFIIDTKSGRRLFYWEAGRGTYSALKRTFG